MLMSEQPVRLSIRGVNHSFGSNKVLHDINFDIKAGQFVSVVGPSGCGKSTLLRGIIGTHPPTEGTIEAHLKGGAVRQCLTPTRDIGIVYQQYSLYDFLTARQNVARGPDWDKFTIPRRTNLFKYLRFRRDILQEADNLLEKVGLGDHIHKYPHQLSGGQKQRVAVAQSLIMKPRVMLLDEPFGALDEAMREELQMMLLRLYQENCSAAKAGQEPPYTIIIVTHELSEAIYVGDRVVGLSQYWDWKNKYGSCPGATIVYDAPAPVFSPNDPRDFEQFAAQKFEIRQKISKPRSS